MLNVACKPYMLNVVMLSVVMLSVTAPLQILYMNSQLLVPGFFTWW